MSEPVTIWRPLIGFDEEERRSGRPEIVNTNQGEGRGDFIRLGDDRDEPAPEQEPAAQDASLEFPLVADARLETPVIRGDFADIEAALLRTVGQAVTPAEPIDMREAPPWARQELRATREDPDPQTSHFAAFSPEGPDATEHSAPLMSALHDAAYAANAGSPSDSFILFDDAAVSGSAAIADEYKRSRRPLYIMAALVLAGITGITATSLRREGPAELQSASKSATIAQVSAENGPASSPQAAVASAEAAPPAAPAQEVAVAPAAAQGGVAAVNSATEAPQAVAASNTPVSPASAPDAQARVASEPAAPAQVPATQVAPPQDTAALAAVPPAPSESEMATGSILAPPSPTNAQALAEPSVKAAIAEAKKVKTAAVRPDGRIIKADSAKKAAPSKVAHLKKEPHAKPVKVAAKAKPATTEDAQPTQTASGVDTAPAAPQKPAAAAAAAKPGPLAFVDTAVSSITGATGKLFAWGRNAN